LVDQATHDFGEVYEGEHLSHTFTIRNPGTAPLEIRDPALKAQNEAAAMNTFVAAALRHEGTSAGPGLRATAAIAPVSQAPEADARIARLLPAASGAPAAPS
jgi:hypothetical protein